MADIVKTCITCYTCNMVNATTCGGCNTFRFPFKLETEAENLQRQLTRVAQARNQQVPQHARPQQENANATQQSQQPQQVPAHQDQQSASNTMATNVSQQQNKEQPTQSKSKRKPKLRCGFYHRNPPSTATRVHWISESVCYSKLVY